MHNHAKQLAITSDTPCTIYPVSVFSDIFPLYFLHISIIRYKVTQQALYTVA